MKQILSILSIFSIFVMLVTANVLAVGPLLNLRGNVDLLDIDNFDGESLIYAKGSYNLNLRAPSLNNPQGYQGSGNIIVQARDTSNQRHRASRSEERRVGKECRSRWSP